MLTQEAAALVRPKFGVQALFLEQLGVAAFFDDAAFVQDDEAVHRGDGGEAVGDGNHGFAFHHFVEAFLDSGFDFGIERAGGFVKQQNRRVFEHNAGDGDALALAAGKFHAAFANVRIIASRSLHLHQQRAAQTLKPRCRVCAVRTHAFFAVQTNASNFQTASNAV